LLTIPERPNGKRSGDNPPAYRLAMFLPLEDVSTTNFTYASS
jgi:hypothetical protein